MTQLKLYHSKYPDPTCSYDPSIGPSIVKPVIPDRARGVFFI